MNLSQVEDELETLAVVKAFQYYKHCLVGVHFTVVIDYNALKATQRKKNLLPRVYTCKLLMRFY